MLTVEGIRAHLSSELYLAPEVYDCVGSTNALLRRRAGEGAAEGTLIAAASQTEGRGRLGRSFFSPQDSGVYFSLLLRPALPAETTVLLTAAAAVAVCRSIEALADVKPRIKWVNDVFVDGKKVCGILTEAAFDTQNGGLDYAVVGVGVNVYAPREGFPQELRDIAAGVLQAPMADARNRLVAGFVNEFFPLYRQLEQRSFLEEYRARSLVIGREVTVVRADVRREALACGIDDDCRLLVRYPDGTCEALGSGEISIRF